MIWTSSRLVLRFALALMAGGVIGGAVLFGQPITPTEADSPGSPVWVKNGVADYQSCSDWKNDHNYFPGTTTPFSYYWSGQPQWWNYPSAHVCWHNDEASSSWWRAIDIPSPDGTDIWYRAEINTSGLTPGQIYDTSDCGGVQVRVWTPNGSYAGRMHFWHIVRNTSIIGTSTISSYYYPGQTVHVQYVGDIVDYASDSCTNTGDHVHQAILQGGWAQPTKDDNVATVTRHTMSFGW